MGKVKGTHWRFTTVLPKGEMEPYMDGVLWLLLSESNVFWECYAEVVEKDNADISGNSKILGE